MKFPASQALHAYWSSLRQDRLAPERGDLDPASMRHLLTHTFVLDVGQSSGAGHRLTIRLSGTRLDALFGRDLKDTSFADVWAVGDRDLVRDIAAGVLAEAAPAVLGGQAAPSGAPPVAFELVLLPLRHQGRTHARMLGGLALAASPSWLGLRPAEPLEVASWRLLDDAKRGLEPAAFAGPEPSHRRYAHLLVHDGGRAREPIGPARWQAHVNAPVPGCGRLS